MTKKFTPSQKLQIVLEHHLLKAEAPPFESVGELYKHYQTNSEAVRQWKARLLDRAEDVFADDRLRAGRIDLEKRCARLERMVFDLRQQLGDFEDDE